MDSPGLRSSSLFGQDLKNNTSSGLCPSLGPIIAAVMPAAAAVDGEIAVNIMEDGVITPFSNTLRGVLFVSLNAVKGLP